MSKARSAAIRRCTDLLERAERLRRECERSEGRSEQILRQLREEFGCESIEDAEDLLQRTRDEREAQEEAFQRALDEFESNHGGRLGS